MGILLFPGHNNIFANYNESIQALINNDLDYYINKYNIDKSEYIISSTNFDTYNTDNVIKVDELYDLLCPICLNILKDPISCSSNKNSHSFCKKCIDKYLKQYNNCPTCKGNFGYIENKEIEQKLSKLLFKCVFYEEGCKTLITYLNYFKHINECKYRTKDILYECQVEKYNYLTKNFDLCNHKGNLKEIEEHFKFCAFLQYNCIFCKENILSINLKDHVENKCKVRILNLDNEDDKYIGEWKDNQREGYGILFYSNKSEYKGEWKEDQKEGYGIKYYPSGDKYEGEWKKDVREGYGIYYYSHGNRFEGQCKNNAFEGFGTLYFSNGNKYEGEWKNSKRNGYGILYYSDGKIFKGEWKNDKIEGYGIYSYLEGGKYRGEWLKNKRDGYGIYYYSNGDKYVGEWIEGVREGYGKYYYFDNEIYEGEWVDNKREGYGICYYSNGEKYEGEWVDGEREGYGIYYYLNNEKYEGEWRNDQREGYGTYYFSDGNKKEGQWYNDNLVISD